MGKMRITLLSVLVLIPVFMLSLQAQAATYTSKWGDFKTVVPDGWKEAVDFEGVPHYIHYTNFSFADPESKYILSIRWYKQYATHRTVDGDLEMYSGPDDFVGQLSYQFIDRFPVRNLIEPVHEVNVGDRKAKRFAGQFMKITQESDLKVKRAKMGGLLFTDELVANGGRQVLTVVPAPSGFYVLAYFTSSGNYGKYEKYYDQMVASFEPKDGPEGEGSIKVDETVLKKEPAKGQWETLLDIFRSKESKLFAGPITTDATDIVYGTRKKTFSSGWFADTSSQEEIINYADALTPKPAIPEEAKRNFAKGTTFMKAAKEAADYKDAIKAYEEALLYAPWWGNAYYNLGIALEKAEWHDDAIKSIKLYLMTKPSEADTEQAQNKIYEIEAQQALKEKRDVAMKAKYGDRRGESFGINDLYRYGAVVQNMSFDASGNERTISLKIVTRKENGFLHTYFHITDLTSHDDIFSQDFSVDWRGTKTFYLDDRGPNKDLMTLTVTAYGDGDANITIRPANNASASIKTSLASLLKELASQAVYAGDTMTVGGRDFYVLGEGGAKGSLLFFPPEIKDQLEHGTVNGLMPKLVANVSYRSSNGQNVRYTNTDLGEVNGTHYHLEFVGSYYEAKVGRGEDH